MVEISAIYRNRRIISKRSAIYSSKRILLRRKPQVVSLRLIFATIAAGGPFSGGHLRWKKGGMKWWNPPLVKGVREIS